MHSPHLRAALTLVAALGLALTLAPAPVAAQNAWVLQWLQDYASGKQAEVVAGFRTVSSLRQLQDDLDKIAPKYVEGKGADAELHRRAIVAFAIEAAYARIDQGQVAGKLADWACRQVRRHTPPDEFDHRAQMATFAILAGAVDPDALSAHVTHVRFQFPTEPRLALEKGIAEELRAAPFYEPGKELPADIVKHREDAVSSYTTAARIDSVRAEALLRLGRVNLDLGKNDEALTALNGIEPITKDPDVIYLARLFRGQALERLGKTDEARQSYARALEVRPDAQTASIALAALDFRRGDRAAADRNVGRLLSRTAQPDDPWWEYWPGDFRFGLDRVKAMREAMK
ncbi:MAG TPA: tetratricopeptide repeat protein [Vicinamibacterales bacterium]|nr:tetratricopeptide repeat protein [Vicinamibacterales bacterium]